MSPKGGGGYGYRSRPAQPPAMESVRTPPGVSDPRTLEPRGVNQAVKDASAETAVAFSQIQYAKQADSSRLVSQSNINQSASGGGGATTTTQAGWYSRVSRFCRIDARRHTSGVFGYSEERLQFDYSLWSLVSQDAPYVPFVLRIEDVLTGELIDNTAAGNISGCIQFGLRQANAAPATVTPDGPFIGFYCVMLAAGYGEWKATVCADAGGSADTASTGITSEDPHLLTIEISGDGTVTFYIDDVQVHQVTGYTGTITHTTDAGGVAWIVGGGGTGVHDGTCWLGSLMDMQATVAVRALDEAA